MSRTTNIATFTSAQSREIVDAVAPTHGVHLADEYEAVDRAYRSSHTATPDSVEVMCTVHLRYNDPSDCGADLLQVARHLLLEPACGEVQARVFQLRVLIPKAACADYLNPVALLPVVRERLCSVMQSELLVALRYPCFPHTANACALLPDAFDEYHAVAQHQWLRDVIDHVVVHHVMPEAAHPARVRRWNCLRVTWSLNDASWRIRPCSYDEWMWSNIERLQQHEDGFVHNATVATAAQHPPEWLPVATTDPLARLIVRVEQAAFAVLMSADMGLHKFASAWVPPTEAVACALVNELLVGTSQELIRSHGAAADDMVVRHCVELARTPTHECAQWIDRTRERMYVNALDTAAEVLHERVYTSQGFDAGRDANTSPVLRALQQRVYHILRLWCRASRSLAQWIRDRDVRSASAVWTNRLLQCEPCFLQLDACVLDPSAIEACWRDVACRLYKQQLPNGARNWFASMPTVHADADADADTKQHTYDREDALVEEDVIVWHQRELNTETTRILTLLSERFVAVAVEHRFHPELTAQAAVAECSSLAPMLDADVVFCKSVLMYVCRPPVLTRLLASVVLWAQQFRDVQQALSAANDDTALAIWQRDPSTCVYPIFRGSWPQASYTHAVALADRVTRRSIACVLNALAQRVLRGPLQQLQAQLNAARRCIHDADAAQTRNALEAAAKHTAASTDSTWKHWADPYAVTEPKWLFDRLSRVHQTTTTTTTTTRASPDASDTVSMLLYRCAACLRLCFSYAPAVAVGDDERDALFTCDTLLYCSGHRCSWYGSLSTNAVQVARGRCIGDDIQGVCGMQVDAVHDIDAPSTWAVEAFTYLGWVSDASSNPTQQQQQQQQRQVARHSLFAGFFNPWMMADDLTAPAMALSHERMEHRVMVQREFVRRQRIAIEFGLLADAGVHRSESEHIEMFAALGVRPPVLPHTATQDNEDAKSHTKRTLLREHRWWLRLHATPQRHTLVDATLYANGLRAPVRVDYGHDIAQGFTTPSDTTALALPGVLAPNVAIQVARAYTQHLGLPWLSHHRVHDVQCGHTTRTHRRVLPAPYAPWFDRECIVWPCYSHEPQPASRSAASTSACDWSDTEADDAAEVGSAPVTIRSSVLVNASSVSVRDDIDHDHDDDDDALSGTPESNSGSATPRSPVLVRVATPSRVSTAGTWEDWGDSDLYSEESQWQPRRDMPLTHPPTYGTRTHSNTTVTRTSVPSPPSPPPTVEISSSVTEYFPGSQSLDYRARQLAHLFAQGFLL